MLDTPIMSDIPFFSDLSKDWQIIFSIQNANVSLFAKFSFLSYCNSVLHSYTLSQIIVYNLSLKYFITHYLLKLISYLKIKL